MEFTKEQIETAMKIYHSWDSKRYEDIYDYLDSLLEPKTEKIVVEIECDDSVKRLDRIVDAIENWFAESGNPKVTILPEVFTREDLYDLLLFNNQRGGYLQGWNRVIDKWLSERESK